MKNYVSESRAIYEDNYHGMFSKKLATWAISKMKRKETKTDPTTEIAVTSLEEFKEMLKANAIKVHDEHLYTAWYLFHMAKADYPKTITSDVQRLTFAYETLYDPDCCPEAVLECFTAKMCIMGVPIYWEEYL